MQQRVSPLSLSTVASWSSVLKGHSVSVRLSEAAPRGLRDTCPKQKKDKLAHFLPVSLVLFSAVCWSALFKVQLEDVKLIHISHKVKIGGVLHYKPNNQHSLTRLNMTLQYSKRPSVELNRFKPSTNDKCL